MCRMLAFIGHCKNVGDLLLTFQTLSVQGKSTDGKGHRDGWGIGYYNDELTVFKKAECAVTSTDYAKIVELIKNETLNVLLAHVRKASPGTPVTDKEVHPFQINNLLFCNNGSIFQSDGQPLGEELDSIIFFKKIIDNSLVKAIHYFWNFKYTSLTCLLTDGNILWAYRDFKEKEDYYTLYYLRTDNYMLFCSEPIMPGEWVLLKKRELVTVFPDCTLVKKVL